MKARLGPLDRFCTSRLLLEIKHHVVKRSDTCDQVHLMEATQEPDEPFRTFVLRLRKLATTCNFYSRCGDEYCTNWYFDHMLL